MGKSMSSDNKEVSECVHQNLPDIDCATGCCLQERKEMGKSIKFRQQRGQ